jgi:hypothetical protein
VASCSPQELTSPREPLQRTRFAEEFSVTNPAWSLDGDKIYFNERERWQRLFYSVDLGTNAVDTVWSFPREPGLGGVNNKTGPLGRNFYSAVRYADHCSALYAVPIGGSAARLVVDSLAWRSFAISPDESRFAVLRPCRNSIFHLVVYNSLNRSSTVVANDIGDVGAYAVDFSPTGRFLLYATEGNSRRHLFDVLTRTTIQTVAIEGPADGQVLISNPRWADKSVEAWGSKAAEVVVATSQPGVDHVTLTILELFSGRSEEYIQIPIEEVVWIPQPDIALSARGDVAVWLPVQIVGQDPYRWDLPIFLWQLMLIDAQDRSISVLAEDFCQTW